MLSLLEDLVNLSSETGDANGLEKVFKCYHNNLLLLDPVAEWVLPDKNELKNQKLSEIPLLWSRWNKAEDSNLNDIVLVTHLDTVYSADLHRRFQQIDQDTATGSGVIDNKGGAVLALWALEKFLAKNTKRTRTIHLVVSPSEEIGSPGFQGFFQKLASQSEFVLGLEPALLNGHLISSRRGNRFYRGLISGNSVHTGRDSEKAANPSDGLAQVFALIQKLKIKNPEVTLSLNGIKSYPFSYNMSPAEIEFLIDLRFSDTEKADVLDRELQSEIKNIKFNSPDSQSRGSVSLEVVDNCPAFQVSPNKNLESLKKYYETYEKEELSFLTSKGASDCNYFARTGLNVLDGLGPRGWGMHSPNESLILSSLELRATALADFLESINKV